MSTLKMERISTALLPMAWTHAARSSLIRASPKRTISPADAASNDPMTPATNSHADRSLHSILAVCQLAMSGMSEAIKQTTGMGTSMTWCGWPAMLAVERGLGLSIEEFSVTSTSSRERRTKHAGQDGFGLEVLAEGRAR